MVMASKSKRPKVVAERREDTDFNYIIKRRTFAQLCFGSKAHREVLPLVGKGLSGYMRRFQGELYPKIAPPIYHTEVTSALYPLKARPCSTKGLVRNEPRFRDVVTTVSPPSTKYNMRSFPKSVKRSKIPFGVKSNRGMYNINKVPGPGQYKMPMPKRHIKYCETFGGKRKMIPGIYMECIPTNPHKCEMCRLTPLVDYWHHNYTHFMCVQCFSEENEEHNKYSSKQLKEFELMRDCSFMHKHDGGKPAITIMSEDYRKMKMNIETHLCLFYDEFYPQAPVDVSIRAAPGVVNFKDTTLFYSQFQQYLMQIKKRKATKRLEQSADEEEEEPEEE